MLQDIQTTTIDVNVWNALIFIVGLPIDNTGKRYIPLMPNDVSRVGALANLTAAKTCWVHASGNDYQL